MNEKEILGFFLKVFAGFPSPVNYDFDYLGRCPFGKLEPNSENFYNYFNENFESKKFIKFFHKRLIKFFNDFNLDKSKTNYFLSVGYFLLNKSKTRLFFEMDYYYPISELNFDLFNKHRSVDLDFIENEKSHFNFADPGIHNFLDEVFNEFEYLLTMVDKPSKEMEDLQAELKNIKKKNKRNFLKEGDPAYEEMMTVIKNFLNKNRSKYFIIKEYANKNDMDFDNLRKRVDNFIENHSQEILERFNLTEKQFMEKFNISGKVK
jgi:hypothetical protein